MADKFWPNSNPIGRRFTLLLSEGDYEVEIVGVAKMSGGGGWGTTACGSPIARCCNIYL
jgi:hypothetical protein